MAIRTSKRELKRAFDETYQQTCRAFKQWERKREETISHFRRIADALDKTQRDVDSAGSMGVDSGSMGVGAGSMGVGAGSKGVDAGLVGAGAMATGALAAVGCLFASPVILGLTALTAGGMALGLIGSQVATDSIPNPSIPSKECAPARILSKEFIENNSLDKVDRTLEAEGNSLDNLKQCLNELIQICDQLEIKRPRNRRVVALREAQNKLQDELKVGTLQARRWATSEDGTLDGGKAKKLGSASNTKKLRPAKSMELLSNTFLVPVFSAVSIGISKAFVIYLIDSIRDGRKSETSQRLRERACDFEFHLKAFRNFITKFDAENKRADSRLRRLWRRVFKK